MRDLRDGELAAPESAASQSAASQSAASQSAASQSGPPGIPGDPDGFASWVRPHLPAMALLAARLAPGVDRDDVVQDSLVRAWTKRRQFDPARGTPAAWLLAITADQARKARGRQRPSLALVDGPATGGHRAEERLDLESALGRLSGRQRLAVDCVYYAGLSVGRRPPSWAAPRERSSRPSPTRGPGFDPCWRCPDEHREATASEHRSGPVGREERSERGGEPMSSARRQRVSIAAAHWAARSGASAEASR